MKGFAHESTYNETKEWYTPRYIFDAMGLEFDLDPCSPGKEVVPWIPAKKHLTWKDQGFIHTWQGNVWMNPPYGSDTPKWMNRLMQHKHGIALVFARTDTGWFQGYAPYADAICFISKRVQFVRAEQSEQYAKGLKVKNSGSGAGSMLIAYGEDNAKALFQSGLGLTLSVGRLKSETVRGPVQCFGSGDTPEISQARPLYENSPRNAESRQGTLFGR